MKKIILASNNQSKINEFKQLTNGQFTLLSQADLNISEVPEDGLSFVENALIKARNASKQGNLPAIADDSGIVVDYLKGQPGIHSARYAGKHGDDEANIEKLLQALEGVPSQQRTARFWCAMVWVEHQNDPTPLIAQASWEGLITTDSYGDGGFGYDPIFYIPSHRCTSAELDLKIKNTLSHRAKALTKLINQYQK